jgi:hypothetical protein
MKTLILASLISMTISGTAHAYGEHCRSQDNSCQQNYRKSEAFKILYDIEGTTDEANSDLRVIEQVNQQYRIGFEPAVGNFIYLLDVLGGRSGTVETQRIYPELARMTGNRLGLAELVDVFTDLYRIEGTTEEALKGVKTAHAFSSKERAPLAVGVRLYTDILYLLCGRSGTVEAGRVFPVVTQNTRDFRVTELYETFADLYLIEGEVQQAIQNFELVIRGALKCGSLREAREEFISLLNSLGGRSGTVEAQRAYRNIFGL